MNKFLKIFLCTVVGAYALCLLGLYIIQRDMLYLPTHNDYVQPVYSQEVTLQTPDNQYIKAWYYKGKENQPTIIFFHGNGGNLIYHYNRFALFRKYGLSYLAIDYRGFGRSTGKPTEEGLYTDAETAIAWIKKHHHVPGPLVFWGHSLGSGIATEMAVRHNEDVLVLEAPLASIQEMGQYQYPWLLSLSILVKDKYDNLSKIDNINSQLLIFHGQDDETVPIEQSKMLYAKALKPKSYYWLPGKNHFDLNIEFIIRSILRKV